MLRAREREWKENGNVDGRDKDKERKKNMFNKYIVFE